jgi:hypothetical protein
MGENGYVCHHNLLGSGTVGFRGLIETFEAWASRARLWAWIITAVVGVPTAAVAVTGYLGGSFGHAPLFQLIPAILITAASSFWLANFFRSNLAIRKFGSDVTHNDDLRQEEATRNPLRVMDIFLYPDDNDQDFKRKLRIVLLNKNEKRVHIRSASWKRRTDDDVELRSQDRYLWQIENHPGSWRVDDWREEESADIIVDPGAAVRTYIGLHHEASQHGISRRLIQGRLGTLTVNMMIDGRPMQQQISPGPICI